jgi:decaprenylphospho-beta-D-erythro-pentofuranosid-2-ulose 2-reductase
VQDAFGHPQSVVVLGGTSDISRELVALLVADRGRSVVLAGRDRLALERAAQDLRHRVARVRTVAFDAGRLDDIEKTVARCFEATAEAVDLVIVAVGELGSQTVDETDPDRVARMMSVNLVWPTAAMTEVAARLRQQGHGRIIVLSSVAGFRIRRSNFIYGAAKAGLDVFAQGLSEALRGTGVSVHIVRPGFVRTKMTAGRSAAPFAVSSSRVAADIQRGLARDQTVIWSPGLLRWLFSLFRLLPSALWRRLPG